MHEQRDDSKLVNGFGSSPTPLALESAVSSDARVCELKLQPCGAVPRAPHRRWPSLAARLAARCMPSLAERLRVPFWRTLATLVLSLALVALLDVFPSPLKHAWTLAWPCAMLAVSAEALYIIVLMYQNNIESTGPSDGGMAVLRGLPGVIRIFDVWCAWTLCVGNVLMIFYILGSHNTHFTGLENVASDASAFEVWSYFAAFALFACAGNGLVLLAPATTSMRLSLGAFSMCTFFVVCIMIYSGTSEAIIRLNDRQARDKWEHDREYERASHK